MISGSVVFYKIATTCLLILAGWGARRFRLFSDSAQHILSTMVVYVATPCYILYYMPTSVSRETLSANWHFPLLGFLLLAVADCFGYLCARWLALPGERATFRMATALPNWVFMALAVCEPLFREDGVRVVLLCNIGITVYLWTFGLTSFRTGAEWRAVAGELLLNVQNIAMAVGLVVAVAFPVVRGMERLSSGELAALPFHLGILTPIWESIYLLSTIALPLSIFQTGMFLGSPSREGVGASGVKSLTLVIVLKLLAVPAICTGLLLALHRAGVPLTANEFLVGVIIMAMPSGVTCVPIAELYGGVPRLAARCILWGTLGSLATVPLVSWLAGMAYAV